MKFPYGMADFKAIITDDFFYCDRTGKIPQLEQSRSQLFIRPRRFGKSLLLSMLENYYDVAAADQFEQLFGHLAIGKNPTPTRNSYYILRLDFSCVDTTGTMEYIKQSFFDHINDAIEGFISYYQYKGFELPEIQVNRDNALSSLASLVNAVRLTPYPIYLLIDEYDNFANNLMMGQQEANDSDRYNLIVREEGFLRTLFKAIKASTNDAMFARVFITGVSPIVMSDITSGYNIADNIYLHSKLNDLCGFSQDEVSIVLENIVQECEFTSEKAIEALSLMKTYYNGYLFAPDLEEYIYNPTLCLYFFKHFQEMCTYPRQMLDSNLATDEAKLEYLTRIPRGRELLLDFMEATHTVTSPQISDRFGVQEMMAAGSKDNTFLISFLYYFGVLTLAGENQHGEMLFKVPNLVIQSLYVIRAQRMLLPEPGKRDDGISAAKLLYQKGDMQPLCDFVENRYFSVFKNRDYRWANELTVKTAFLTLLYNDILYIMDSEPELNRRYADLTMIIRPDKRHFTIVDVLIEFKFISLKDAGLSGEQAKALSRDALYNLPIMQKALANAVQQGNIYGNILEKRYDKLRLQKFAIAALGFERVCWKRIDK